MKSILLIGLGRFGRHIAMHLDQLGHQVMAVDNSDERAEDVLPIVTNAQIGDSTNEEFLESLGVRKFSRDHFIIERYGGQNGCFQSNNRCAGKVFIT